jgi:enoyl-CoA hydratase/carnithine racemase
MEEVLIDRPADGAACIARNRPEVKTALMRERKAFQLWFDSEDRNEGVRAFREKRKSTYQGK